jgi:thiol:disulfide interchange protein DsbD
MRGTGQTHRLLLLVVTLFPAGFLVHGQPIESPHARVELLARQTALSAGPDLQLGIHFILEPGWHIYWINPGDSGQPPSLQWQLPPGFTAGAIQWPRPERMQATPELADYGYHGELLLPVMVHVRPALAAGSTVPIVADAKWLVCREVCIPEHAQLRLELPVAQNTKDNPQSAPLFAKTDKLMPRPLPRNWNASIKSGKDEFVLSVHAGKAITKAEFFPLEPNQIDNAAPQKVSASPQGFEIALKKSDLLLKPINILRGVLVIPGGPAYRIEAPVRQPIQ